MPERLLSRTIEVIEGAPLTGVEKRDLLSYVVAGEYALAVGSLCERIAAQRRAISRDYCLTLSRLAADLDVPRGAVALAAERCPDGDGKAAETETEAVAEAEDGDGEADGGGDGDSVGGAGGASAG